MAVSPLHEEWHDPPETLPSPEQVSILLVDDLPDKLMVYRTILEELGENLVMVRSGEEALKKVLKQEFAVILLDVNMPGMDGFETAALIRQRRKSASTPIIFLTAFTDEMHIAQGYASGAVDFLPTPVVPEVLKAKVRVFIELSRMRRQAAMQAEESARRAAAEESARRMEFLATFSEQLARSQNQAEILHTLATLPIPYLADVSIMHLPGEDDEPGRTEWACRDRDTSGETLPALPWLQDVIARVLESGRSQFVGGSGLKDGNPALPLLGSVLALPLSVRGQVHGVLVLARLRTATPYQQSDLSLASDVASRAGVALENVMLVERIREADRRKDEFLGMLAHELRNPLGPIRNAVQLLQMLGPKEPKLEQLREIVGRQVTHMTRLIDDLLDATRLARGKVLLRTERCDLGRLVRQTVEDYRHVVEASGLAMELSVPETPVWVEGDPTRLVQAIGNFVHNAHKFTPPGGVVSVTLQRKGGTATVTVRDTGIGIDRKMLACVFDVFRQAEQGLDRSQGGLGLGLALVKGLVELHGGQVQARSGGQNKGSEFVIRLPVAEAPAEQIAVPAQVERESGPKGRILVIEDNRDAAESARQLLSLEGYDVAMAHTGVEGLELARTFRPRVILCDIGLPGMDGYQVVRTLRGQENSTAYIVALTGYGRDEDQKQAIEAGFDLHLTKPIDYHVLRRALSHLSERG